jgi:MYXO-CTERM domain-containing protein
VVCGGDEVYQVAVNGTDAAVCVPDGSTWPNFDMPAALRVEQVPMMGPAQVVVDNEPAILAALATQQASVQCLSEGTSGTGTDTGTGEDGTGDSVDGSGSGIEAGDEVADESGTEAGYDLPYDTSCGCANSSSEAPLAIGLGLLVLGLTAPRRRRDR